MSQKHLENIDMTAEKARATIFVNETVLREFKAQAIREGYNFSDLVEEVMINHLQFLAENN